MTTASPIPASLATACAAHDRHRLDVIDALLDEAAPSAVRELLGAALDLCASLRADRDTLAAKLDATPKVCAIHSYALEGPCMTCGAPWPGAEKALRQERVEGMEKMLRISRAVGCPNSVEEVVEAVAAIKADLASERAHLAACRTRIAGLEQAANERAKEDKDRGARMDAIRAALGAHQFASDDHIADRIRALTARVAELEARPVNSRAALIGVLTATKHGPGGRGGPGDCDADCVKCEAERALASLGAPPTSPTVAVEMRLCEATRVVLRPGTLYRFTVDDGCEACRDAATTSPPAARPAFAGVSIDDLLAVFFAGWDKPADNETRSAAGLRAVLARLEVTQVKPVDPEEVAKAYHDSGDSPVSFWSTISDEHGGAENAARAMRATLTAAGIPVTPEVRK